MADFEIPENPEYTQEIRKFEPTDPAHADLFNTVTQALVNNDAFLKDALEDKLPKTGTAASASKWSSPRSINGISIDGTANRTNYGICSTSASTAAKTVTCTGFGLITGAEITMKFTYTNTASSPTLNVNGTGAKPIYYRGSAISASYLGANRTYTFRYNGAQWDFVGDINVNTDSNTWKANTASSEGYVAKGSGNANKVWKTDASGNPAWREESGRVTGVKGNEESSYRIGNVNITPANIGAASVSYVNNNFSPTYIATALFYMNEGKTWRRVAKYQLNDRGGYDVNAAMSCTINIKRGYNAPAPEYHRIHLASGDGGAKFIKFIDHGNINIQKIRVTWDDANMAYYLELYYNNNTYRNGVRLSIEDVLDTPNNPQVAWKILTKIVDVPETEDGMEVLASADISKQFNMGDPAQRSIYGNSDVSLGRKAGSVVGVRSFAFGGGDVVASGEYSFAQGFGVVASDSRAHAEGWKTTASGAQSHAEGAECIASGHTSHAEGWGTEATTNFSHAEGYKTKARNYASHASGKYNKTMLNGGVYNTQVGDVFVIGNGTSDTALSNALRVTYLGDIYGTKAFQSSGADYAEFIKPWADGNPDNEDRVGYFVTVKDGFLEKAKEGDYIAGITSGNPSIVGNADEDYYWKYERDEFNRIVMEDVPELVEKKDENGNFMFEGDMEESDGIAPNPVMVESGNMVKNARMKLSEDYDPELQKDYIERKDRKEWDYVGMLGVLPVRDDGTCIPGQFCKCAEGGIASFAKERGFDTYMVLERITENVVSVILK